MTGRTRAELVEAGFAWDAERRRWVPPGQLFGDLPQTAARHDGRRRVLIETTQLLLRILRGEKEHGA